VETGFARSFRPCSVGCVAWVVRSCPGEGLCRPQMMMALEASFPLGILGVWSPGRLLTRLRVGIFNFAPPGFCGDESTAEKIPPGCGCVCPVSGSTLPALGCSCPAPRGGSRAARVLSEELSFALFVGSCVCCIDVGTFTWCRTLSAGFFLADFPFPGSTVVGPFLSWPACLLAHSYVGAWAWRLWYVVSTAVCLGQKWHGA